MSALSLGLVAALCWGFHDICVRFLSQKVPVSACIITVLTTGLIFHTGLMVFYQPTFSFEVKGVSFSALSGVAFVVGTFALYYAFQRGPVKVVAPLIATFPLFSVGWAVYSGTHVSVFQWAAVLAIILGVSLVAGLSSDEDNEFPPLGPTIILSLIASAGFAATFATGQSAAKLIHEIPATLITRLVAVVVTVVIILLLRAKFWSGWSAFPWLIAMGLADGVALFSVIKAAGLPNQHYASVASSTFGLLTIVLAWAFLKERLTIA